MGLNNAAVRDHMDALFGEGPANDLRTRLDSLTPGQRELTIIGELCKTLRNLGPKYVLPFRFKDDRGSRTSHHLIFVSKNFKGYEIMKDIMAKESSDTEQGVANFAYSPVDDCMATQQLLYSSCRVPLMNWVSCYSGSLPDRRSRWMRFTNATTSTAPTSGKITRTYLSSWRHIKRLRHLRIKKKARLQTMFK